MIRRFAIVLAACGPAPSAVAPRPAAPAPDPALPTALESDRWFLVTATRDGAPLRLYLDSAGGMFLTRAAADRLKLAVSRETLDGEATDVAPFPALADPRIPRPELPAMPVTAAGSIDDGDGMLGAPWFAGHTFAFDYPRRRLELRAPGDLPRVGPEHRVAVGFPRGADGAVISPYGRIQMTVDGETIDMLLDTGATVDLTDTAIAALGGTARLRATSFITRTVFDRWHAAHPDWRVLDHADRTAKDAPMIEVPRVSVGGYEVGPVWFTWRPDDAFHQFMAQYMDKPSEGALGGDAFRTLRVTVDWTAGAATFER